VQLASLTWLTTRARCFQRPQSQRGRTGALFCTATRPILVSPRPQTRVLRAAAAEGGEFFVLINNDTAFGPDFCGASSLCVAELRAGVIAPRIMRLDNPELCWYAGGSLQNGWLFLNIHHHEHDPNAGPAAVRVDFASGCCLGIDRSVLEQVGLLDESFFVYWEDTDFCMRLKTLDIPILYVSEPSCFMRGQHRRAASSARLTCGSIIGATCSCCAKTFGCDARSELCCASCFASSAGLPATARCEFLAGALALGLVARLVAQARLDWEVTK